MPATVLLSTPCLHVGRAGGQTTQGSERCPQVSEAKTQLRDMQDFWISLPGTLCSEKMAMSASSDDRCWNGMAKGRWVLLLCPSVTCSRTGEWI